ncbi:MAG: nucleoside 2-deoxyribosyltransferase domain-containing protein [Polyangiaceae bacterium]
MPIDVFVAPDALPVDRPLLFLAGGISGCPDWHSEMIQLLSPLPKEWALLNPRRPNFPIDDPTAAEEQIAWEHHALRASRAIVFWFPEETLCPITLYELGAWSMTDRPLFVGVHPRYARRSDVEIQTRLARPDVSAPASTLAMLAGQILDQLRRSGPGVRGG